MSIGRRLLSLLLGAGLVLTPGSTLGKEPPGALAGDRDVTFSGDGVRFIDFGRSDSPEVVFVDDARRATLAGSSHRGLSARDPRLALARLLPDGRLDGTFGADGRKAIDLTSFEDRPFYWDQAPDGTILAAGTHGARGECSPDCEGYFLTRLLVDGRRDRSFGSDGVVLGRLAGDFPQVKDILALPGGGVLVLADVEDGALVRRYRRNGSRDRGFGSDGAARIGGVQGSTLLRQASGRTIVVIQVAGEIRLHALRPDGRPDRSFGREGQATIDLPGRSGAYGGVVTADDRIVLFGSIRARDSFDSDVMVARFEAGGDPDGSFGAGDGWISFDLGNIDEARAVRSTANGRIVVTGAVAQDVFGDDLSADLFIGVLKPDGCFRRSFGDGGVVREDFGRTDDAVYPSDLRLGGGRVIVVGNIGPGGAGDTNMFAARYLLRPD